MDPLYKPKQKYTTVFPGIRDQYQVPLALFEKDRLGMFITDIYQTKILKRLVSLLGKGALLSKRYSPLLIGAPISTKPWIFLKSKLLLIFFQKSKVAVWEDLHYSKLAYKKAKKDRTSLFLYEFQAEYAFKKKYAFPIRKILFQFHPHPHWEHPLLLKDALSEPELYKEVLKNTRQNLPEKYKNHTCNSWKLADHILVASGITKFSLIQAGCPEEKISLAPYGISHLDTRISPEWEERKPEKPFFLFVGSGTQRKGLHHLCRAWKKTPIHRTHDLILISRWVEPFIEKDLNSLGIRILRGVSKEELNWHFQKALCFVLPSLSEGFGQVYLESLVNGCPIIGSRHSMLPDIEGAQDNIIYIDPLNENSILEAMEKVAGLSANDIFFNKNVMKNSVVPYTWENFRNKINYALDLHEYPS